MTSSHLTPENGQLLVDFIRAMTSGTLRPKRVLLQFVITFVLAYRRRDLRHIILLELSNVTLRFVVLEVLSKFRVAIFNFLKSLEILEELVSLLLTFINLISHIVSDFLNFVFSQDYGRSIRVWST